MMAAYAHGLEVLGADVRWKSVGEGWSQVHETVRPIAEGIANVLPIAKPFVQAGDAIQQAATGAMGVKKSVTPAAQKQVAEAVKQLTPGAQPQRAEKPQAKPPQPQTLPPTKVSRWPIITGAIGGGAVALFFTIRHLVRR